MHLINDKWLIKLMILTSHLGNSSLLQWCCLGNRMHNIPLSGVVLHIGSPLQCVKWPPPREGYNYYLNDMCIIKKCAWLPVPMVGPTQMVGGTAFSKLSRVKTRQLTDGSKAVKGLHPVCLDALSVEPVNLPHCLSCGSFLRRTCFSSTHVWIHSCSGLLLNALAFY